MTTGNDAHAMDACGYEAHPEAIDHYYQLHSILDAYDRALTNRLKSVAAQNVPWIVAEDFKSLMHQAIEQAWDDGHACSKVNSGRSDPSAEAKR